MSDRLPHNTYRVMQYVRYQVQSCQFPWHWRGFQHQALADDFADLSPKSSCQMQIGKVKGRLTSSAASACTIANSIKRAISSRVPVIARSPLSNRLRAFLPRVPLRVRSLSESSAESDEYNSALPCKVHVSCETLSSAMRPTSSVNASGGGVGRRYRESRQS